jgi:hypothetical protein
MAGFEQRAVVAGVYAEEPGDALDHHAAGVAEGFADQGDAGWRTGVSVVEAEGLGLDPFGAGSGFPGAASAEDEPGAPGGTGIDGRCNLVDTV